MQRLQIPGICSLLICVFVILAVQGCTAGSPEPETERTGPPYSVGYKVIDVECPKEKGPLTIAVWYPTAEKPESYTYGGPTQGRVAPDADILAEEGPYPLLVFSHGYGGSGLGAVFFTEQLAAHGWIVAAPDHHDRYSAVRIRTGHQIDVNGRGLLRHAKQIASSSPKDRSKYVYRLDEMKLVLESMLAHPLFGNAADRDRIAVGGHSFGGYTALGLCGTVEEYHDPRVKAVLLFSTGAGGYLFTDEELRKVKIPSMLFMGEREKRQKRGDETMSGISDRIYSSMSPPKYFLEIKGGTHFSFNSRFKEGLVTRLLSGTEEQFSVIRKYSTAFLEKHVAEREESSVILKQRGPMLSKYIKRSVHDKGK